MKYSALTAVVASAALLAAPARAYIVQITIESLAPSDGVSFSPVWLGFHDGTFDAFDAASSASSAIESIAELGDGSGLNTALSGTAGSTSTTVAATSGFNGAIFTPGQTMTVMMDLDPTMNRYMSWGAMVVPSNDWFTANDNPMAAALFDGSGNFMGAQSWTVDSSMVYDAGTEVNDASGSGGAAFIMGDDATMGTSESSTIAAVGNGDFYLGVTQATGLSLGTGVTGNILRISVVPEPSTYAAIFGLAALVGAVAHRRRKTRAGNRQMADQAVA